MQNIKDITTEASRIIAEKTNGFRPQFGIVLGSGLGPFADAIKNPFIISYDDLPGFPKAGVAGHAGRLVLGEVNGVNVAVMQGRAHYYEQAKADVMKTPVKTLKALGAQTLILTNAAGSLREEVGPGSVINITDHINYTGMSPLFGVEGNARFVNLTGAYDEDLQEQVRKAAVKAGVPIHTGVYMWFSGPHFETPAEIRMARMMGAHAVGMSTVPEVILARYFDMKVMALSIVTNWGAGMDPNPLSHEQTMKNSKTGAKHTQLILQQFFQDFK